MKRLLVLVLLVPILALTMISCDADMRSNIANLMGGFGGNIYEEAGLIVANTAQAEAAAATVAAIGTGDGAKTVTAGSSSNTLGVSITVPTDVTKVLAPQSEAEQTDLKENLADAFNSDTQKKQLLEELKTTVAAGSDQQKAAQGSVLIVNATLDQIKDDLPDDSDLGKTLEKLKLPLIADGDNLTQGDMLALQLMTDLISNTVATLKAIGDGGAGGLGGVDATELEKAENKDKVLSIIDDALFAAEVAEQISGAASIDFTGQIDLKALFDGLGDKGTDSRNISLTDAGDFISTINDLAPTIIELMGVTYIDGSFVYSDAAYKSFLLNQQIYRSSMEQALKMMALGKLDKDDIDSLTWDTSTLVKYTLAVLITEHDAFVKSGVGGSANTAEVIQAYLNANPKLGFGTLTKDDELTDVVSLVDYEEWPGFLMRQTKVYYEAILTNIITINDAAGITAELSTELEKFRDAASTEDGLTKWYNELL